MSDEVAHELGDIGKNPIPGDSPVGIAIKYEPVFEQLEAELAKSESLTAETTDWNVVKSLAADILQNHSKDFLVACYLTYSLALAEGYKGIYVGAKVIKDMMDSYWDDMFPPIKRLRARQAPMNWLVEKLGPWLQSNQPAPTDAKLVVETADLIKEIDFALSEKMEDKAPNMVDITRPFKNLKQSMAAEAEKQAAQAAPAAAPGADPAAAQPAPAAQDPAAAAQPAAAPAQAAPAPGTAPAPAPGAAPAVAGTDGSGDGKPSPDDVDHELKDLGKTPIAGDSPVGIAVKYEPVFEALEAELAKSEGLTSETTDWSVVKNQAVDILQNHSKDFLVACYLTYALALTEGYKGIHVGSKIMKDMVETFWDDMFPPIKRLRARQTPVNWLVEKLGPWLAENQPAPADAISVLGAGALIKDLDFTLSEKMESQAPSMVDVTRPFKNLKQSMEAELNKPAQPAAPPPPSAAPAAAPEAAPAEAAAPPPPPPPPPKASSSSGGGAPEPVGDITSAKEATKAMKTLQDGLKKLATFAVGEKLSDPKPYRLNRMALWMNLDAAPPNNDGKTQVPPPMADKMKKLKAKLDAGEAAEFITEMEAMLAKAPYNFDGQRMLVNAMDGAGVEFKKARDAIVGELRHFLTRVPQIVDLKYSDDSPFADEQTKMWLSSDVMVAAEGDGGGGGGADNEALKEAKEEAKKLASSGKAKKAMQVLDEGLKGASALREQFQWRLAIAEILLASGNGQAAASVLERVTGELDALDLGKWEPGIPAQAYKLLLSAYEGMKAKPKAAAKAGKAAKGKEAKAAAAPGAPAAAAAPAVDPALQAKIDYAFGQLCWYDPASAIK